MEKEKQYEIAKLMHDEYEKYSLEDYSKIIRSAEEIKNTLDPKQVEQRRVEQRRREQRNVQY